MATFSKLEGRITVPTGGWDAAVAGTSSGTATIPAGTYYLSSVGDGSNDLLAEVASQFSTTTGDTVTCTAGLGEFGTGKTTLTSDIGAGTLAVTWTDTDLRDVLGFTGNLSGDTTYTSTNHCRSVWLPNCAYMTLNGSDDGYIESNFQSTESEAGHVYALYGQSKTVNEIGWDRVLRKRVWIANESTTNESFEKFYRDVVLGEAAWSANPAGPIRWYPDADTDATYHTYKAVGMQTFRPERWQESWTGRFRINLPRMVVVPA